MSVYLLSTPVLLEIAGGFQLEYDLDLVGVSRLSIEWILADNDLREGDVGQDRQRLRANLKSFISQLEMAGGQVFGLSDDTIEEWGKLYCSSLNGGDDDTLSFEELMVMATASASGMIYVTWDWPWTSKLDEAGVVYQVVS